MKLKFKSLANSSVLGSNQEIGFESSNYTFQNEVEGQRDKTAEEINDQMRIRLPI